jgi:translin
MLDEKLFKKLRKEYDSYDVGRRIIIKHSNDILKFSKQSIFALHREDVKGAEAGLKEAEKLLEYLGTKIKDEKRLQYEGAYLAAMEEFVEANLFYQVIKNKKFTEIKGLEIGAGSYLGGVSDLTGELVRRAVILATKRRYKEIAVCHQMIESIVGELIQFNLMGPLRHKFDQAKHSLRKIEEIMYDLEIKRKK